MNQKELSRYPIIEKLIHNELTEEEAANLVNLCVRQVRRLKKKVLDSGPKGLIHGNRGKTSHNCILEKEKERIIELLYKHYYDFKPGQAKKDNINKYEVL